MSEEIQANNEQVLRQITTRAAVDGDFRARLLSEPHAAIDEAVGVQLPTTLRIQFIEKSPDLDALIVLPDLVDPALELTEEELEAVAGGSEWRIGNICLAYSLNVNTEN